MLLCLVQAWLLALLAAQKDDRLALLHLGHLHHQGLHGVPADLNVAYAYYANIAKQTNLDRHNPSPQQVIHTYMQHMLWCADFAYLGESLIKNNSTIYGTNDWFIYNTALQVVEQYTHMVTLKECIIYIVFDISHVCCTTVSFQMYYQKVAEEFLKLYSVISSCVRHTVIVKQRVRGNSHI